MSTTTTTEELLNTVLWSPSTDSMDKSVFMQFVQYLKSNNVPVPFLSMDMHKNPTAFHQAVHQWSVQKDSDFWGHVWNFLQIKHSTPYNHSITNQNDFMQAQFYVGAKTNYAENLLRLCLDPKYKNKEALVSIIEEGISNVQSQRKSVTFGQLHSRVAKLAHTLRNTVGLKKMDRVVSLLPNGIEAIVALLAVTSIGAVWSSVSLDLGKKVVYDRFSQIRPSVLFTCEQYTFNGKVHSIVDTIDYLVEQLPTLKSVIRVQHISGNNGIVVENIIKKWQKEITLINYEQELERYSSTPDIQYEQVSVQHPIFIMYTSGTTGQPKCITQGFGVLVNHVKETHIHCDITDRDTAFIYTNCGWMMWNWMVSILYTGAKLILYDGSPLYPNALAMWRLISKEKITCFGTSSRYLAYMATSAVDLVSSADKKIDISHLRLITTTGSPLAPLVAAYVYRNIHNNVHLSSISGGTDLNGCFCIGSPLLSVYPSELQCAGLGMDVQIWNESGKRIFEENGELVCLNPFPSAPLFFWGDVNNERYIESYFSTFEGVWSHGDLAEQTHRHGFYVKGRSDTTLNPGGVRIGTADYYDVLNLVKEVDDSVVVGQREKDGNERVVLFVQLKNGISLNDQIMNSIYDVIRKHLSPKHRPSVIAQVSAVLVNINGKKMEKLVKKVVNNDPVQPKEYSSLKNPDRIPEFRQENWKCVNKIQSRL
jgi:acetoacetyl-CoA synthetase